MPRHAPPLECTAETIAELVAMSRSRSAEVRMVERARIVLACLGGKEIQQVAEEVEASIQCRCVFCAQLECTTYHQ